MPAEPGIGFHTKLGTANHLMIFDRDYFEILGIVEDTPFEEVVKTIYRGEAERRHHALA